MAISTGGLDLQTAKGYGISLETATDYNDMGLAGIYDKRSEKVLCLLLCPLVFLNRWLVLVQPIKLTVCDCDNDNNDCKCWFYSTS